MPNLEWWEYIMVGAANFGVNYLCNKVREYRAKKKESE